MLKKIIVLLTILMILALSGCAQTNSKYKHLDVSYGTHTRHKLDIVIPKDAIQKNEPRSVILFLYGGDWTEGDKSNYNYAIDATNEMGYVYVSMNYRYALDDLNYLDLLDDVALAIRFLKYNKDQYYIKDDGIALIGSSAGAHLSMLYGYKLGHTSAIPIKLIISQVGPTNFVDENNASNSVSDDAYGMLYNLTKIKVERSRFNEYVDHEILKDASPITHVTKDSSATISAYGKKDHLIHYNNALSLEAKLTEYQIDHALITYENSGHDLNHKDDLESKERFNQTLAIFLEKHLKPKHF